MPATKHKNTAGSKRFDDDTFLRYDGNTALHSMPSEVVLCLTCGFFQGYTLLIGDIPSRFRCQYRSACLRKASLFSGGDLSEGDDDDAFGLVAPMTKNEVKSPPYLHCLLLLPIFCVACYVACYVTFCVCAECCSRAALFFLLWYSFGMAWPSHLLPSL